MAAKTGFSPKQKAFCREYVKLRQGKAAAIAAGYAKSSAEAVASRLLSRNKKVQAKIASLEAAREKKALLSADEVETILDTIIVRTKKDVDKINAIKLKMRRLGLLVDKVQHSGEVNLNSHAERLRNARKAKDALLKQLKPKPDAQDGQG